MKSPVTEFSRVLGCRLNSCVILKSGDNLLKFLELKLSPQKSLWWIPVLVATFNICKNRLSLRSCPSGYCEKYHVQSMSLWSSILASILIKKINRLAPSCNLKNGVCLRRFAFGVLRLAFFSAWVSFYSKFASFFSKAACYWPMKINWKHHRGLG